MFLCDYHTHTHYSFDGDPAATHDAMCRRALEVGLTDIAFTDHCDINAEVEGLYDRPYDADRAFSSMMEVKEKYKGRLNVVCGLELGNATQYPAEAAAVLAAHPYEFVIGSLHNLHDVPDFCLMNYGHMSNGLIQQLFNRMLDETLDMIRFPGITTLGHLTYMHRYITLAGKTLDFKPYYGKIEHIYRELMARDIALELNVSTLWKGLGISMPTMELLKLYKDCGGKLITIGTDAHAPVNLGKAIRKGYAILETVGFHEVLTVQNGQRVLRSIQ
ncbi:MAG: histidinol-phosphatase HisJ family protein [Clostridia bacterium]|nr:histidinol-phosphatase HisJ family protein [Clostridia bacterium]